MKSWRVLNNGNLRQLLGSTDFLKEGKLVKMDKYKKPKTIFNFDKIDKPLLFTPENYSFTPLLLFNCHF